MVYAFILGRVYTLSLAEALRLLDNEQITYKVKTVAPEIALIETENEIDCKKIQDDLGGTIKIVKILDTLNRKQKDFPIKLLQEYLDFKTLREQYLSDYTGKVVFGVSVYIMDPDIRLHFTEPKKIAQLIKKYLTAREVSVRFVMPEPPAMALPSVVVTNNHMLEKGAEFVILLGRQNLSIGKTMSVQDFEDYGRRDYQRPFRDLKMGMLPPKVAQIMINLAGIKAGAKILDPFCGGGTVIQEALLKNMSAIGSDIDATAVAGADKNVMWFSNRYNIPRGRYEIKKLDATSDLSKSFDLESFDAIITEGWLGPLYSAFPTEQKIKSNFKDLLTVYVKFLEEAKKVLKNGQKIVITVPAYRMSRDRYVFFPMLDFIEKLGYIKEDPIDPELVTKYSFLKVTDRKTIIYDRKDQIVAREIIIIRKR